MHKTHEENVQYQFGPQAAAYVESSVHANGADLDWIEEGARMAQPICAIDLGAGGGHVAYRLAKHAGRVVACDLSSDMVEAVLATAQAKGLKNVEAQVASAESLPCADHEFDFLACRFSAHHWRDFDAGLREARRVLATGATALFVDVIAPEQVGADMHLQAVELLRDPSHVRDYRPSEWLAALGRAGFTVLTARSHRLRMDFDQWTQRMNTVDTHKAAIRSLQSHVPDTIARYFDIEADGSFTIDCIMIEAR